MKLLGLLVTLVPLLVFVGAALFCIHEGHCGFAIVFTVFSALSVPKISVG